uniref:Uncharacterized protein n=1 Tax=Romanomermis culicivorax TaxID=13658 RepID=A0A915ILF8_ROMCU
MALSSRCPVLLLIRCILLPFIHGALASIGGNISQIFRVYNATFSPPSLLQLKEGSTENVNLILSFVYDDLGLDGGGVLTNFAGNGTLMTSKNLSLCYRPEDPAVAWVPKDSGGRQCVSSSLEKFTGEMLANNVSTGVKKPIYLMNTNFSIKGLFLGKTDVIVEVFCDDDVDAKFQINEPPIENANKWSIFKQKFHCAVVRKDLRLQHIFVGTLSLLLIIANVLMGAQLNLDIVFNVIKTPLAPAIGFVCQYLFMPLEPYSTGDIDVY